MSIQETNSLYKLGYNFFCAPSEINENKIATVALYIFSAIANICTFGIAYYCFSKNPPASSKEVDKIGQKTLKKKEPSNKSSNKLDDHRSKKPNKHFDFNSLPNHVRNTPDIRNTERLMKESNREVEKALKEQNERNEKLKKELNEAKLHNDNLEQNNEKVIEKFNNLLLANKPQEALKELENYQTPKSTFGLGKGTGIENAPKILEKYAALRKRALARNLFLNKNWKPGDVLEMIKDEPEDEVKAAFVKRINENNK